MKDKIPEHLITTTTVTREIEGQDFEFAVEFTFWGELIKVENNLINLPEHAQRLTLGNNFQRIFKALQNEIEFFKYCVPLAILGYMSNEEWQLFQQKSQEIRKNNAIKFNSDKKEIILSNYQVNQIYEYHFHYPNEKLLPSLAKLIEIEDWYNRKCALEEISGYSTSFVEPLLKLMRPKFKHWAVIDAYYACLKNYPSEVNYKILSTDLLDNKLSGCHPGILKGLSVYEYPSLYKLILNFYEQNKITNYKVHEPFLKVVSKFNFPKVRLLLEKYLIGPHYDASGFAFKTLLNSGISKKQMAILLKSALIEKKSISILRNVLSHYEFLDEPDLWPPVADLIDLFEWYCVNYEGTSIFIKIRRLLHGRLKSDDMTRIYSYLENENEIYRIGGIKLLSRSNLEIHGKKISRLLLDKNAKVVQEAINSLDYFAENFEMNYLVPKLIHIIENNTDYSEIRALSVLAKIVSKTPQEAIFYKLKKLLEVHALPTFQIGLMEVISKFEMEEADKLLLKLSHSTNNYVKEAAIQLLRKIK